MNTDDINKIIALDQGWLWRWSNAKQELRWYDPDGHNYAAPPNYCGDLELVTEALSGLIFAEPSSIKAWYDSNPRSIAQQYVRKLSIRHHS